jgi:hypothetical protein
LSLDSESQESTFWIASSHCSILFVRQAPLVVESPDSPLQNHTIGGPRFHLDVEISNDRDARTDIRGLRLDLNKKTAEAALLTAQLNTANARIEELESKKKRKRVKRQDSNAILATVRDILRTQELVDLEEAEEVKRQERRKKKALRAAT